jgi:hypothetical protein
MHSQSTVNKNTNRPGKKLLKSFSRLLGPSRSTEQLISENETWTGDISMYILHICLGRLCNCVLAEGIKEAIRACVEETRDSVPNREHDRAMKDSASYCDTNGHTEDLDRLGSYFTLCSASQICSPNDQE